MIHMMRLPMPLRNEEAPEAHTAVSAQQEFESVLSTKRVVAQLVRAYRECLSRIAGDESATKKA